LGQFQDHRVILAPKTYSPKSPSRETKVPGISMCYRDEPELVRPKPKDESLWVNQHPIGGEKCSDVGPKFQNLCLIFQKHLFFIGEHMKRNKHCILLYQTLSGIVSFCIFFNEKKVNLKNQTQQQFVIGNRIVFFCPFNCF
jgi:hypothetical protein